jgi:hypothetical protein
MDILEYLQSEVEREKEISDSYIKNYVDLLKWSTTICLAAILWITNSFINLNADAKLFSFTSIIFLILSIIIAISCFKLCLDLYAINWDKVRRDILLFYVKIAEKVGDEGDFAKNKETEYQDLDNEIKGKQTSFSNTNMFNRLLGIHITLLILGIILYLISIGINVWG